MKAQLTFNNQEGMSALVLVPSDVNNYERRTSGGQASARFRVRELMQNMTVGYTETTIVPWPLVDKEWGMCADPIDKERYHLVTEEAYDSGTHFRIENKM